MIYRAIVARRVRAAWNALQVRRSEVVLRELAPTFEHTFAGEHALGGARHAQAAQADWFQRLFAIFPDINFNVRDVLVTGPLSRTRAVAIIDVPIPSEPAYTSTVLQLIELRFGKITRIENHENTQALARFLDQRATTTELAGAPPITS